MERVDVEIMPWIKDELRIKLDEANTQELVVAKVDPAADELRINQLVEERLRLLEQDSERAREAAMSREIERIVINEQRQFSQAIQGVTVEQVEATKRAERTPTSEPISTELPNIYRPKDIPLSILLWNYVFLLARKPKNMAIFFLSLLVTGLLVIVGPAPMTASVVEVSALVTSRASNMRLPWVAPKTNEKPVLSIPGFPAHGESEFEVFSDVATEAQDLDTVTVSDSSVVSENSSSALTEELVPEDAHAHADQVKDEIAAASETLAEQALDGEDVADEAAKPRTPEMIVPSDSPTILEGTESTSVESVQKEQAEDQSSFEQSDEVEIETEAPVAPENVEIEVASVPVDPEVVEIEVASVNVAPVHVEVDVTNTPTEEEASFVAPDSPKIEHVENSAPQSFLFESPAFCSLVDEDGKGNDESMASSPSHVGEMHHFLPYSVLFEQQEACKA
jgi:hypothetical protein